MAKIISVSLIDFLPLTDRLSTNQHAVSIIDTIDFIESHTDNGKSFIPNVFNDQLIFHESIIVSGKSIHVSLSDTITFTEKVWRVHEENIIDTIDFKDHLYRPYTFSDELSFVETFVTDYGTFVSDKIKFIETLNVNHLWSTIHLSDTITFTENIIGYDYTPYKNTYNQPSQTVIDQGTGLPTTAPILAKKALDPWSVINTPILTITRNDHISLISNTTLLSIVLRNPSFGNQYKLNYNRLQRETRGRDLLINGNSTYPYKKYVEVLSYTIDYLKQVDGKNIISFFNNNLGLPITLIDYENITWTGILTTPEVILTQKDRANYSVTFELEIIPEGF